MCRLACIENLKIIWLKGLEVILHNFKSIFSVTSRLFDSKPFLNFVLSSLTLFAWDLEIEIPSPRKQKKSISIELKLFPCLSYSIFYGAKIIFKTFWSFAWCQQLVILERFVVDILPFCMERVIENQGNETEKFREK